MSLRQDIEGLFRSAKELDAAAPIGLHAEYPDSTIHEQLVYGGHGLMQAEAVNDLMTKITSDFKGSHRDMIWRQPPKTWAEKDYPGNVTHHYAMARFAVI